MKTFKEFLNETSFKVGDKVKEVEPMGQFKPGDVLEIVRIKSGRIGVIAQGQNPKDALFDNPKNFKLVNEAIKTDFDLQKYIEDLAINLDSKDKPRARKIRLAAEKLEMDSSNRDYQSDLTSLMSRLPKDKNIQKLSDAIEDYLETL